MEGLGTVMLNGEFVEAIITPGYWREVVGFVLGRTLCTVHSLATRRKIHTRRMPSVGR